MTATPGASSCADAHDARVTLIDHGDRRLFLVVQGGFEGRARSWVFKQEGAQWRFARESTVIGDPMTVLTGHLLSYLEPREARVEVTRKSLDAMRTRFFESQLQIRRLTEQVAALTKELGR